MQTFTGIPKTFQCSNKIFWCRNKKYHVAVFFRQHKHNLVTVFYVECCILFHLLFKNIVLSFSFFFCSSRPHPPPPLKYAACDLKTVTVLGHHITQSQRTLQYTFVYFGQGHFRKLINRSLVKMPNAHSYVIRHITDKNEFICHKNFSTNIRCDCFTYQLTQYFISFNLSILLFLFYFRKEEIFFVFLTGICYHYPPSMHTISFFSLFEQIFG